MISNAPEAWTQRSQAGTSHEAAMWSESGQRERYAAVLSALDPRPGETLYDYGCGTGLLSTMVPAGVGYLGYDWSRGMIERAQRDHPLSAFVNEDLASITPDLIACIGTFNLADGWSKEQTWTALSDLWSRCGRAMAVCLYAGEDEECIRYRDSECMAFAKQTRASWSLERHRPNDLLLVLGREDVRP